MTVPSALARCAALAAVVAALAAAAAGTAGSAPTRASAPAAADPLAGTFVLKVGYGDPRTHTITQAGDGLVVTATQAYVAAGSPAIGTPFLVLDRVGGDQADTSPASCQIAAGTVVLAKLKYVATDSVGVRHYQGVALKAVTSADAGHPCQQQGLSGPVYLSVSKHGDTADKDGPANMVCWNTESVTQNSCGGAFVRLAGTWTAGSTGGTATGAGTTTGATSGTTTGATTAGLPKGLPPRGLVPWDPKKWYRDAKFKADRTPPVIKALPSTGTKGQPFFLQYNSTDDGGYAGETYRIYRGTKLLKAWTVMAGERDGRVQRAPATLPASVSGALFFCVGGTDMNGNRTGWSCSTLTIS